MDPTSYLQNMQQSVQQAMEHVGILVSIFVILGSLGTFFLGLGCLIAAIAYWRKNSPATGTPPFQAYQVPPQPPMPLPTENDLAKKYGPQR